MALYNVFCSPNEHHKVSVDKRDIRYVYMYHNTSCRHSIIAARLNGTVQYVNTIWWQFSYIHFDQIPLINFNFSFHFNHVFYACSLPSLTFFTILYFILQCSEAVLTDVEHLKLSTPWLLVAMDDMDLNELAVISCIWVINRQKQSLCLLWLIIGVLSQPSSSVLLDGYNLLKSRMDLYLGFLNNHSVIEYVL